MLGIETMFEGMHAMLQLRAEAERKERERLKSLGLTPFEVETIMVEQKKAQALAAAGYRQELRR